MKTCPLRGDKPCIDDVCSSFGDDECPWPPARLEDWTTEPDGPGSGDDRYGDKPAQERVA